MLELFKKLFSSEKKPTQTTSKNQDLIEKVQTLAFTDDLVDIINQPHNKLLIMNVYYVSFEDLLFNLVSKVDERQIAAVNIYGYFKTTEDVNYSLKRIIPILQENDINMKLKHDLEELVNTIEFLVNLEEST